VRIAVIGNCQSQPVSSCLERSGLVNVAATLDINQMDTEYWKHAEWAVTHDTLQLDYVLTQPLSLNWGNVATEKLRNIYGDRLLTMTNIFFEGLHPDSTDFGAFGERVESPLGDYHSRLGLIGYLRGLTVTETLSFYRKDIYRKMGYFDKYNESAENLKVRDKTIDIKFAETFFKIIPNEVALYSANHPTANIVLELCSAITQKLFGRSFNLPDTYFINVLAGSAIFPIYPEIAEYHGLPYRTDMIFYPIQGLGNLPLGLLVYLKKSFQMYDAVGRDKMLLSEYAQQLITLDI